MSDDDDWVSPWAETVVFSDGEMPSLSDGKCVGQDPMLWDLSFYEWANAPFAHKTGWAKGSLGTRDTDGTSTAKYAERLCEGCPVLELCAREALRPINGLPRTGVIMAGVPLRLNGSQLGAKTRERLEKICGITVGSVSVSQIRRDNARDMRESGKTVVSIAKTLGVSVRQVERYLSDDG